METPENDALFAYVARKADARRRQDMNTSFKITTEYGHAFIASRSGNCALGDTLCFYRREIGGIRVLGKNIHLTTYGTMHAECATYLEQFLRVSVEHDDAELNAVAFAVTAAKVKILHDDSQPGGLDVAGAGLQAVLVDGTQGELMAHLRMYAGQPLIVTQTKEGVAKRHRGIFIWTPVE